MKKALRPPFSRFFGTLANQNRLDIINLLKCEGPLNVTDIGRKLNFKQPTVSLNLGVLERCGFVFVEQKGKTRIYSLNKKTIKPLLDLMDKHMDQYCKHLCCNDATSGGK